MENTYLYIVLGPDFLEEAEDSIKSLRVVDALTPVTLFTDCREKISTDTITLIDTIHDLPKVPEDKRDKASLFTRIDVLLQVDAQKVIVVDTDTLFRQPFELWDVLDSFPLAFAYDPIRWDYHLPDIPDSFPTPNCGMLAMRKTSQIIDLLERWKAIFHQQMASPNPPLHDQPAFRQAVWESSIRFLVLPSEFNLRVTFNHMLAGNARVKLLHGRHEKLRSALDYADSVEFLPRVYGRTYPVGELLKMLWVRCLSKLRLHKELRSRGAKEKN